MSFWSKIKNGFKKAGKFISHGAKKIWSGIKGGAKKVGHFVSGVFKTAKKGASTVYGDLKSLVKGASKLPGELIQKTGSAVSGIGSSLTIPLIALGGLFLLSSRNNG